MSERSGSRCRKNARSRSSAQTDDWVMAVANDRRTTGRGRTVLVYGSGELLMFLPGDWEERGKKARGARERERGWERIVFGRRSGRRFCAIFLQNRNMGNLGNYGRPGPSWRALSSDSIRHRSDDLGRKGRWHRTTYESYDT